MVRTAFVYLYLDLALLTLALVMAVCFWEKPPARLFLAFWAVNFAVALWAKRGLILDLLEGRTEVFRGKISHREDGGSLRCAQVEYLVEQGEHPRRFLLFPNALPLTGKAALGLASGRITLKYLPRSLAVVELIPETEEEPPSAPRRTKGWYEERAGLEEQYRRMGRPRPLSRLRDLYWFWELVPTCLFLAFAGTAALLQLLQ